MSNRELAEKLRSRAKFLSGLDWQAADALEGSDSLTGEQVMAYFTESDIKLLPWQLQRLLSKPKE